jgi:hypothetical protein
MAFTFFITISCAVTTIRFDTSSATIVPSAAVGYSIPSASSASCLCTFFSCHINTSYINIHNIRLCILKFMYIKMSFYM